MDDLAVLRRRKTREEQREQLELKGFSSAIINLVDQLAWEEADLWYETLVHMEPHMVLQMNRTNARMEKEKKDGSG